MNAHLSCDETTSRSNAERYVARAMAARDAEAFEDHFVACADCQREVRFASSVAAGLAATAVAVEAPRPPRRAAAWGGAGLAIAAGIAAVMILISGPRRAIVALGGVREPPAYLGISVRAAGARPDSLFEAAMDTYERRRFAEAAQALRAALTAGEDSVPARFFLAASLLMADRASEAASQFERVIAYGDQTYLPEARYYRAKALLRSGRASGAQAELARLTAADGVTYAMGRALADSIARAARE